jgi:hypothetical protein
MNVLHVIPDERSATWRVYEDDVPDALSEHTSTTDAELAAQTLAEQRGAARVVVQDRYHRTREPSLSLAEMRAGARATRARQLAAIRKRLHEPYDYGLH